MQLQRHTEGAQASGPSVSKPFGKEVFGGGRHQHCPIHSGQRSVLQPQSEGTQHAVDASGEIMLERLEETSNRVASRLPVPWEVVCLLVEFAMRKNVAQFRNSHVDDVHHVHEANRGLEGSVRRRGEANWQKRSAIPQLDFCDAFLSSWECHQRLSEFDESLELDLDYHRGVGDMIHRFITHHGIPRKSTVLQHSNKDLTSFMELASTHLNLEVLGKIRPLSFQTWWGQSRCSESAPGL